jgi:hypothetical protein
MQELERGLAVFVECHDLAIDHGIARKSLESTRHTRKSADEILVVGGSGSIRGRVASGDYSPKAPTDPDERDYRIRLFGARLRYVTGEEMCGWGSG